MKCLFLSFVLSALAFSQTPDSIAPATPQATPATPQAIPQAQLPPDTVVAKVGNKPITAADISRIMLALPPEVQGAFSQNPKNALQSLFMIDFLRGEAEKNNLAEKSPYKEQLEFQRSQMLAQAAALSHQSQISVTEAEEQKRYDEKKTQFDVAKIRAIHLSFTDPKAPAAPNSAPAGKVTEAEAKAKADDLVKQLRAGADFAAIAKAQSDDKGSAEKGGEYGSIRRADNIPDDIKSAIFTLKPGDISAPVRQPNGFYILKVEERSTQAFKDVQPQLAQEIKQERYQQWMQGVQKQFEVSIENPAFFGQKKSSIPMTLQTPSAPPASATK